MVVYLGKPEHSFLVYGDNKGVIKEWWNGRSWNQPTNNVFRRIHRFLAIHGTAVFTRYVTSASNPADGLSREIHPSPELLFLCTPLPPALIEFLKDAPINTVPTSRLELSALSKLARMCGTASQDLAKLLNKQKRKHRLLAVALQHHGTFV